MTPQASGGAGQRAPAWPHLPDAEPSPGPLPSPQNWPHISDSEKPLCPHGLSMSSRLLCRWNVASLSPWLAPHFPGCFWGPARPGERSRRKSLGREEAAAPVTSQLRRRSGAHRGGPRSRGGLRCGHVQDRGTEDDSGQPGATRQELDTGGPSWGGVVFRTRSKGPSPERDLNSNFLPGFEASVNFRPFLFGSGSRVSAGAASVDMLRTPARRGGR